MNGKPMNVILVGYRGTGKSEVGRLLAGKLGLTVVSLDAELVKKAGKAVPEIVAERGWPGFRDLEEEIVRQFAAQQDQVIDCGGGVIEREANFEPLRNAGIVIWLKAKPETIVNRIGGDDQRPSLTGTSSFTDEVVEVLRRRTPLYQRIAHHEIDTDNVMPAKIADEIVDLI
ncbi:Shikimate kinase 2 [Novipirellula aureliae]|uniref:Shikimate kinase n=1 Tax=Novipirellula aureliae TaxID=2527966 RepID=A0A5C6E8W9_9BACT|nr:shikimate kinase [Novipirellula aureliae]TWU45278.1 Shikimate kinase 2 [Novipirellula aureliae]